MTDFKTQFNAANATINEEQTVLEWTMYAPAVIGLFQKMTLPTPSGGWVQTMHVYDFSTRVLTSSNISSTVDTISVTPFAQLDPETLAAVHDKLVALGGNPPALSDGIYKRNPVSPPRRIVPVT